MSAFFNNSGSIEWRAVPEAVSGSWPRPPAASFGAFLTVIALAADYALIPALYNGSTLWATATLALLVYRRGNQSACGEKADDLPAPSAGRLLAFCGLHALLLLAARSFAPLLTSAAHTYSLAATAIALTKFAVLFPVWVLVPRNTWRTTWRWFRPEFLAALVVLFTYFPVRLFVLAWPEYAKALGYLVFLGSRPLLPGLAYVRGASPIVSGPLLDVQISFYCSGLGGIYLFDYLFGAVMLLEWPRLDKRRALASYALGLATMTLANVLRIILLVLTGNWISASIASGKLHIFAGWIFCAIVCFVFLQLTLGWMRGTCKLNGMRSHRAGNLIADSSC